jgi:putative tryptophan/tyrosine transport system substrate-binding protein
MIKRREFIAGLGGAAAWPLVARAQQPALPVIGFLNPGSPVEWAHLVAAFKDSLADGGYIEGRNVAIEYRWGGDRYDRMPEMAADLVRRQVAVIVTAGGVGTALAAKAATSSIPIVFVSGTDPVDAGLVSNLSRPDANLTGVYSLTTLLSAKRQEMLHELVPSAAVVAMLVNPSNAQNRFELTEVQAAAAKIGQHVRILTASSDDEIDVAFATLVEQRIGGLLVQGDVFFTSRRVQLVLLTTRHAIPTIFAWREFVTAGGLMSYGASLQAAFMGLQIQVLNADTRVEIDAAFATFERERPDALFVGTGPFFGSRRVQMTQWAARSAVPAIYGARPYVEVGGLASYGTSRTDSTRQQGIYVAKILKGARPADLPVVQSTKFELVINAQTARMLGLTVPQTLLATADEVIQ